MPNMSYCRMENTYNDLREAYDFISDDDLSESEKKYSDKLIKLCKCIASDFNDDDED